MKRLILATAATLLAAAGASGTIVTLANVPDFSQHANPAWRNYCAPTCGGDVAYYFGNTYANLRQGNAWGNDNGATGIIGGLNPLPPPPGSMAQRMGTTLNNGTTPQGLMFGLDGYVEDNWDNVVGGADWSTYWLQVNPAFGGVGAQAFWDTLQDELDDGSGIILAIGWFQGLPPDPPYDAPDDYYPDEYWENPLGHAVTMVGYDDALGAERISVSDPANNAAVHNWAGEGTWYNITINPPPADTVTFNIAGVRGTIYGAVITNIPAPDSTVLLGLGGLLLSGRRR